MNLKISSSMIGWIIFIAGGIALIGSQVLRVRGTEKNVQQDQGIEKNKKGVENNEINILKLSDEFRSFQQLNIQDKFKSYTEQKYGLTQEGMDKILFAHYSSSKIDLDKALSFYLSNKTSDAVDIFEQLITETNSFEVRAISNSYLGHIGISKVDYSKKTINYLLEAENLFKKFKTGYDDVNEVRASNYYDLAFYYKTHSHLFELAQTYYLNSIEIYENINDNISGIYSSKLGTSYNDLYILTKEGNLKGNPFLLLERALFYKRESLNSSYDYDTFANYINSLRILGNYYRGKEDYLSAIKQFEEAIQLIDDKILEYPSDNDIKLMKAETLIRYSEIYLTKYEKSLSKEDLTEVKSKLDLAELLYKENTSDKVTLYDIMQFRQYFYNKGTLSRFLNDYPQAIKDFNNSLKQAEILISQDNSDYDYVVYKANIFYEMAITYKNFPNSRDCKKAKYFAKKALKLYTDNIQSRKFYKRYLDECTRIIENCK